MQENYDSHPLDLSYLIEMVGYDVEFMTEVFDTFIEQTPIYLAEMEGALSQQNWEKVAKCAHKIKPTFSYIGRDDVKDFMQTMEDNARQQLAVEQLSDDFEKLKTITESVYIQILEAKKRLQNESN